MKVVPSIRQKWLILVVAIIYRYYLDLSYVYISETYPVEFPLKTNMLKLVISYLIIGILILITYKKNLITCFLFRILTFFTIIPLSSVYAMKDESSVFFFLTCFTYFIVQWLFIINHKEQEHLDISPSITKGVRFIRYFCFFIVLFTIVLMYLQLGIPSLAALVLENVYDIRQDLNITSYSRYMLFTCAQVIIPFGIADGYTRKGRIQVISCVLIQLLFYLWTGNKTWFFSIFLILAIMFLITSKRKPDYFFVGMALLCSVGYYGRDGIVGQSVGSLLNRRVLLDPAALKFSYYDYFIVNNHDRMYFSSTVLWPIFKGLTKSKTDFAFEISSKYADKSSNAITGIYGGDLANWGLIAFVLVPLSLYLMFFFAERLRFKIGKSFTCLFLTYIFYTFNDHAIVAFLLDFQGVFLLMILFFLSRKVSSFRLRSSR